MVPKFKICFFFTFAVYVVIAACGVTSVVNCHHQVIIQIAYTFFQVMEETDLWHMPRANTYLMSQSYTL